MSIQFPHSTPHLQSTPQTTQNALQILHAHHDEVTFSTGSPSLDSVFSSKSHAAHATPGLRPESVLELFGPPGAGKTRTLLGMVVQARLAGLRELEGEQVKGHVLVVGKPAWTRLPHHSTADQRLNMIDYRLPGQLIARTDPLDLAAVRRASSSSVATQVRSPFDWPPSS